MRSGPATSTSTSPRSPGRDLPFERYYHWCFVDNWEWALGEVPRFGLVHLDYESQERTVKDSGRFYAEAIRRRGVTDAMVERYVAGHDYRVEAAPTPAADRQRVARPTRPADPGSVSHPIGKLSPSPRSRTSLLGEFLTGGEDGHQAATRAAIRPAMRAASRLTPWTWAEERE